MTRLFPAVLPALLIAAAMTTACTPAETAEIGGEWHLIGMDGQPAKAPASIDFAADGKVTGKAPCNRYFGSYSGTLPQIAFAAMGATRMACPDLDAETAYFNALQTVTAAEVTTDRLLLTGPEGRVLEFVRDLSKGLPCQSCTKD